MKATLRPLALGLGLALSLALPASAIEFGASGLIDNLQFLSTDTAALTTPFPNDNYSWGARAYVGVPIGEDANLLVSYERDPILRNMGLMLVEFERGVARISVGPFFGFLNADAVPFNIGLSTEIRFQWPGVAFASVKSEGAMAIGLLASSVSQEPQARAVISAGFYAKNSIISATVSSERFAETDAAGLALVDSRDRYIAQVDLYKKNVPYTLSALAGYEQRSKFFEADAEKTDVLGSVILGTTATVMPMAGLTFKVSFESSVFSFGLKDLTGLSPSSNDFLFRVNFGIDVNTDDLPKSKPRPKQEQAPAS